MSWGFQPLLPSAAQLTVNDGLAVGAGVTVSPDTLTGSATGFTYNTHTAYHSTDVTRHASSSFNAAVRMVLLLGVQLVVATGSGVSDTASAPSGSAAGAGAATGAGVTVTASAPTGFGTGGGQGSASGAGASVTTSAPAGSAAGAGAATGAGSTVASTAPTASASGQSSSLTVFARYSLDEVVRNIPPPHRAARRLLLLNLGPGIAVGVGVTASALAPSGSADGGGTPVTAVGAGVTVQAFPPAGAVTPPAEFRMRSTSMSAERVWMIGRQRAVHFLLLSQQPGAASGGIATAVASPPQGGAVGDYNARIARQALYFPPPEPAHTGRTTAAYLALINSFGPDFPVSLQAQWDDSVYPTPFYTGRPYPWTIIILGQKAGNATGAGVTVSTNAPTGFATGDGAGLATGAGVTATTSAPVGVAVGNTTTIVPGITVTASSPTGSATGGGGAVGSIAGVITSPPAGTATGGGSGNATGTGVAVSTSPPQGSASVEFVAVGAGVTVVAFEANATATGDALAVGQIATVTAFAPEAAKPVRIGEVRVIISTHRTRVEIT